jgi:hypothetical protein
LRRSDPNQRIKYPYRLAAYLFRQGRCSEALEYAEKAVQKAPWRFGAYVTRASIRIGCGYIESVPADIAELRRLAEDIRTGEGKAGRFLIDEIQIRYEAITGNYRTARQLLERYKQIPTYVRERLTQEIAHRLMGDKGVVDTELVEWAEEIIGRYTN